MLYRGVTRGGGRVGWGSWAPQSVAQPPWAPMKWCSVQRYMNTCSHYFASCSTCPHLKFRHNCSCTIPSKLLELAVTTGVLCHRWPTSLVRRNLGVYISLLVICYPEKGVSISTGVSPVTTILHLILYDATWVIQLVIMQHVVTDADSVWHYTEYSPFLDDGQTGMPRKRPRLIKSKIIHFPYPYRKEKVRSQIFSSMEV